VSGRPVTQGTPFYNFSIVKGATATIAHLLAERGLFAYDTPVAELWPEFAAHGKQGVTIRHVLTQSAGVPLDTTPEDLCDWDKMCNAIADAELWWEPGAKVGYHAYTFGYIVGEVVRRATGKPISQVLREEVAGPLGVAGELYFGMPESEHHWLARLEDAEMPADMVRPEMPPDLPMFNAAPMALMPNAQLGNRTDILAADIPAGGKISARAIARLYAALLGPVHGVRLLSPERLKQVSAVATSGTDEVFGRPSSWTLGYSTGTSGRDTAFGWGGAGGSLGYADTATGLAFALTKNRLTFDFNTAIQVSQIVTELGATEYSRGMGVKHV
jgi:CubicO group peptidase (beta-lactamase class C family)